LQALIVATQIQVSQDFAMKIISWNVNGIRACSKKGLQDFINEHKPDIFCVQETKAHIDQVEQNIKDLGYKFSHWSSAVKKGYSGVAVFTHQQFLSVDIGFGMKEYDSEGRINLCSHKHFDLYNIYFPNGNSREERHDYKQRFLKDLNIHLKNQIKAGKSIIVVGDYNIAHTEVDLFDPVKYANDSGFLPEEREWFDDFLSLGFVDTFRKLNPNAKDRYSWWSYRELARISNRGWRIDYICITKDLAAKLKSADILDSVQGSDHAPVVAELDF
jgi:exodeoxyribonuclease-3